MPNRIVKTMAILFCAAASSTAMADEADEAMDAVYAMTNAAEANAVAVYVRDPKGQLMLREYVSTEGRGSGGEEPLEPVDALGSQGALVLSADARWLLAVNAGSDELSVFRVGRNSLKLTDKVSSGGAFPSSVTMHHDLVYVLNAGGEASIQGFRLQSDGTLWPLPDSLRSLSVGGSTPPFFLVSPAQIGFDPSGEHLILTIKGSNEIRVFAVDADGLPSETPVVSQSAGTAPFGFGFDTHRHLVVVEPFGRSTPGTAGAGAVSTYDILADGSLELLSESVDNGQTATCWLSVAQGSPFAYATNNASHTISGYRIDADGALSLLDESGVSAQTGSNPIDVARSRDGRYLYAVNAGEGTISAFRIDAADGALTPLDVVGGLPERGTAGLAAR